MRQREFFKNVVAITFAKAIADDSHGDAGFIQQSKNGVNAGAWLDDLIDRFAAEFMKGAVDEEARLFFKIGGKIRRWLFAIEPKAHLEHRIVDPFQKAQNARIDVAHGGAIHVEQNDGGALWGHIACMLGGQDGLRNMFCAQSGLFILFVRRIMVLIQVGQMQGADF